MPFREHDLDGVPLALVGVVPLEVLADEPCLRPNNTIRPGIEGGTSLEDFDANRVFLERLAGMVERTGDDIVEKARTVPGRAKLAALQDARQGGAHFIRRRRVDLSTRRDVVETDVHAGSAGNG
jgi:hypothetical protein